MFQIGHRAGTGVTPKSHVKLTCTINGQIRPIHGIFFLPYVACNVAGIQHPTQKFRALIDGKVEAIN